MTEIGHYAGLLDMGSFALAMTTDGVGSKVLIANAIKKMGYGWHRLHRHECERSLCHRR